MSFTPVTITGRWEGADGNPASGRVWAIPSAMMVNAGLEQSVNPVVGVLDDTGSLVTILGDPFILNSTEDEGTTPESVFYTFAIKIDGQDMEQFNAFVPTSSPTTIELLQENAV